MIGVSTQCEDHDDAPVRVVERGHEVGQEASSLHLVLDQCEQFLELVDDEHESCRFIRQDAQRTTQQTQRLVFELRGQAVGSIDRRAQQRRLQLGEWVSARHHRCEGPPFRSRETAFAQRRHDPCSHHARFPGTTRADERDQPRAGINSSEHLGNQTVASEEVLRIRLAKCVEALERVDDDSFRLRGAGRRSGDKAAVVHQDLLFQPP
ncbi:MAG: hypothetical protein QOJ08_1713 [Ilumatobacteraceae bacterium]